MNIRELGPNSWICVDKFMNLRIHEFATTYQLLWVPCATDIRQGKRLTRVKSAGCAVMQVTTMLGASSWSWTIQDGVMKAGIHIFARQSITTPRKGTKAGMDMKDRCTHKQDLNSHCGSLGCAIGTHGLCPRFLDITNVDTTHRLGIGGTKVLHVIHKSISSLLFFKSILRYLFVLPFL